MMNRLLFPGSCCIVMLVSGGLPLRAQSVSAEPPLETIQLYIWNRSGQDIQLQLQVDGRTEFAKAVKPSKLSSSINAGRVIQVRPGSHRITVHDETRKIEDSIVVDVANGTPNVGVHLGRNGVAFVVTRYAWLAEFTPGLPHTAE